MDFSVLYTLVILLFILDDVDTQFFRRRPRPRKTRKRVDVPKCTEPCLPYRTCKKLVKQGMHTPLCSDYYTHKTFQKIFEKLRKRGGGKLRPVDASHLLSQNTPESPTETKQNAGDVSVSAPQANMNTGRQARMNNGRQARMNTGRQANVNSGRQARMIRGPQNRRGMPARNPIAQRRKAIRRVARNFQRLLHRGMPPRHLAPRLDIRDTAPQPDPPIPAPHQTLPAAPSQVQPALPIPVPHQALSAAPRQVQSAPPIQAPHQTLPAAPRQVQSAPLIQAPHQTLPAAPSQVQPALPIPVPHQALPAAPRQVQSAPLIQAPHQTLSAAPSQMQPRRPQHVIRPITQRITTKRPTTRRPSTPNPDALQETAIRSAIGGFHSMLLQRPKNRFEDFTDVPLGAGVTQKPTTTTSGWEMSAEMQDIVALETISMDMFTGELNPNSTEARCVPCGTHDDCNVPMGLYCYHSLHCNRLVCQELHKRPVPEESV